MSEDIIFKKFDKTTFVLVVIFFNDNLTKIGPGIYGNEHYNNEPQEMKWRYTKRAIWRWEENYCYCVYYNKC